MFTPDGRVFQAKESPTSCDEDDAQLMLTTLQDAQPERRGSEWNGYFGGPVEVAENQGTSLWYPSSLTALL